MKNVPPDLQLAFDVGHSSIGWAVLKAQDNQAPEILGCGSVIFPADDCLASQRRGFRRQRRHIRATRQRISRIERLLAHLGVMTKEQLERKHAAAGGHSAPWLLAARILRGGKLLAWEELWDVLRWYAHNRGYDGNKAWSAHEIEAEKEDTEKVENARALYTKHGTHTMAETFCAVSGLDPLGAKISCNLPGDKRPKALNAAFPREDVEREVRAILEKHSGKLPKLDADFIRALMEDWRAVSTGEIVLPGRYLGGLLFGQLVPRFENRIIATCPMTFERVYQSVLAETNDAARAKHEAEKLAKVPAKDCPEFLRFRWAMQVANIQVATGEGRKTRTLTADERNQLDAKMRERGFFTPGEFKKAVREITGGAPDNIEQMLTHPDADKALILDPPRKALSKATWDSLLTLLPEPLLKRALGQLRRGKTITLGNLIQQSGGTTSVSSHAESNTDEVGRDGARPSSMETAVTALLDAANTKKKRGQAATTREEVLAATLHCDALTGRAPHSREIMREAADFVFTTDRHPTEEGGPLYRSEAIRAAQLQRAIDEQTNNHLVRHRLLILERLHRDILKEYAGDNPARIARATIEVNRDLRELSGKTAKQVAQDLGIKLKNFKDVAEKMRELLGGHEPRGFASLVRKARIAEDLGRKCPYTGRDYDLKTLINGGMALDHIIPRSLRQSDSLDSLVVTFPHINEKKSKMTGLQFVEWANRPESLAERDRLGVWTVKQYLDFVESLDPKRDPRKDPYYKATRRPIDDALRKWRRKEFLLRRDYVEKEFTPRDLTQTSQLVRLGAQMLERAYRPCSGGSVRQDVPPGANAGATPGVTSLRDRDASTTRQYPVITSLPGSVTGAVRKSWNLLGCLATANPQVLNPDDLDEHGRPKVHNKTEIRGITHLHHALDACVLAFTSLFFPRDGGVWELLVKRKLNADEQKTLKDRIGRYVEFGKDGESRLIDLPTPLKEQVRKRLAERRVVQHIPAERTGLRVEQNAWRVVAIKNGEALLRQRIRQPDGTRITKETREKVGKLLGVQPGGDLGKLQRNKAALVIPDNFGLALDPEPVVIPFHKVPVRLRELRDKNGGKWPRVLRNGMLIRVPAGRYAGTWKIFSAKATLTLDLGAADKVTLASKGEGQKREVQVKTLLRDGLEILKTPLTGIAAPPTE